MKLTRQHMAVIAFIALLIAVVVLRVVGGESGIDVAERLEGAMGMALVAFLYETKAPPAATLLLVVALALGGCGGASSEQRATACQITNAACAACETARQTYCGGEEVEVEE